MIRAMKHILGSQLYELYIPTLHPTGRATAILLISATAFAADDAAVIQVEGSAPARLDSVRITPPDQSHNPTDAADLLKSTPGANVNKNGPITGIVQYRGMYGSRVNVQVDGLNIAPAGPNWMDPPLSHVAPSQLKEITVIRGVAPVSAGAESVGGSVQATSAALPYSEDGAVAPHGAISGGYDSNNRSFNTGVQLGISSGKDRLQFNGSYDKGQDTQAGNGKDIVPTQYKRRNLGVEYGHRFAHGEGSLGYTNERVDNAGSPALPMDIIYVKGNSYHAAYHSDKDAAGVRWLADIHYMDTDHKMDNYSLRQVPLMLGMMGMPMYRHAVTNARDFAYKLHASLPAGGGRVTVGTDGWMAKHNADVFDPTNAAFFLQNYNGVKRNRYSLFSEWDAPLTDSLAVRFGVRYSRVQMDSATVSATGFGGMLGTQINMLAANFNNSQQAQNDNLVDVMLQLTQRMSDHLSFSIGAARKQRAPSYQERHLWSPLESTAGLADMRTYVGNIYLNPETSYNLDAGFDWHSERVYFTPRVFFKRVNNYIQGTALTSGTAYNFRVAQGNMLRGGGFCTANPLDPFCIPLQFSNVDAEFYGADAGFGVNITDHVSLDGSISYVRGKRRDISDNLYRMAPLNSTVALSYYGDTDWSVTGEGIFYGWQDRVSTANSPQPVTACSISAPAMPSVTKAKSASASITC